jgi:ABC-type antimicrobial peptide transport system permease subunit
VPFKQDNQVPMRVIVRTSAKDPTLLLSGIRQSIAQISPDWPIYDVKTLEDVYGTSMSQRKTQFILIGSLAFTALLLSVVGVYGAFSYAADSRSREFAVRLAMGASRSSILMMTLKRTSLMAMASIGIGGILLSIAYQTIKKFLFGVNNLSVVIYFEAALTLIAVAFICTVIPTARVFRKNLSSQLRDL